MVGSIHRRKKNNKPMKDYEELHITYKTKNGIIVTQ